MKNIKFYLMIICPFLVLLSGCKKDDVDTLFDPKDDETEEVEQYEFTLIVSSQDYDNPGATITNSYTFDFTNGSLIERSRHAKEIEIIKTEYKPVVSIPSSSIVDVRIMAKTLNEELESINQLRLKVQGAPNNTIFRETTNQTILDPEKITFNQSVGNIHSSESNFEIELNTIPQDTEEKNFDIKIFINNDISSFGSITLPFQEIPELPFLNASITKSPNVNQSGEVFPDLIIDANSDPLDFLFFEHGVGSDGCPMQLFNFDLSVGNSIPGGVRDNFFYAITDLSGTDAINIFTTSNQSPTTVELNGITHTYYQVEIDESFSTNWEFNCARAADVDAQAYMSVLYKNGDDYIDVMNKELPIRIEMR